MEDFKLNGISINFRHRFLIILSDTAEKKKITLKFKEGTNEDQNAYYFNPEIEFQNEIIDAISTMLKFFYFNYRFEGKNLIVECIENKI